MVAVQYALSNSFNNLKLSPVQPFFNKVRTLSTAPSTPSFVMGKS